MDPKDYRIIVSETFDRIEQSLRRHAVEGIEPIRADNRLDLELDDQRRIALVAEPDTQSIALSLDDVNDARFSYHEIEEQWLDAGTEDSLGFRVNRLLSAITGSAETIPRDDLP